MQIKRYHFPPAQFIDLTPLAPTSVSSSQVHVSGIRRMQEDLCSSRKYPDPPFQVIYVLKMIYQVGKEATFELRVGRKQNDIDPLESDFIVQPLSPLEFPGPLTPPPPWNFQFSVWWGSGYFLEPHIVSMGTDWACMLSILDFIVLAEVGLQVLVDHASQRGTLRSRSDFHNILT